MFGRSIHLFTLFGFSVDIDLSWFLIAALVVWSLAGAVFPQQFPDLPWTTHLLMGLLAALGFFASIVVHELCHSLVARRYGLPMKGITLFVFGGVAEMSDEPPSPKAEALMALAGPAASVAIGVVLLGAAWLGNTVGWPGVVSGVLGWIGLINLILAAFNLIPGFPLDGGRVLRAILWKWKGNLRRATFAASRIGNGFGWVLIALGFLNLLTLNPIGGLWWILIGMFVRGAAQQGYQQVIVRQALQGEPVRRFMKEDPVTAPPDISIRELVDDYIYRHHFKMFPVVGDQGLRGCVTTRQVQQVPQDRWVDTQVRDIVIGCDESNAIAPDTDATQALARMSKQRVSRMLVVDNDTLVGVLKLKDMLDFLSLKIELEGDAPEGAAQSVKAMAPEGAQNLPNTTPATHH